MYIVDAIMYMYILVNTSVQLSTCHLIHNLAYMYICIIIVYTCTCTCTCVHVQCRYLGEFIGEGDEELAIPLPLVGRQSEDTRHIVTLWALLLL